MLTKRQHEVYEYIQRYVRSNGYAPTLEEIGTALGMSSLASVHKHLTTLKTKGLIRRKFNHSRSMELADSCPTCGRKNV